MSDLLKTTDTISGTFPINAIGQGARDADSTPTGFLVRNGVIDESTGTTVVISDASSGFPGFYSFEASYSGFAADDWVEVYAEIRVASKTYYERVFCGRVSAGLNEAVVGETFDVGSHGALLQKLNVGAPDEEVVVVPEPGASPNLCYVYGTLLGLDGNPMKNLTITAEITPEDTEVKVDGYAVSRTKVEFYTNAQGKIIDGEGHFYVQLIRTSAMLPADVVWEYHFVCEGLIDENATLEDDRFDFSELIG